MLRLEAIGNLGADAKKKVIESREYVSFDVAVSRRDKAGQEHTTWVSVLSRNEAILPYLKKGTKVFVRGYLSVSTYKTSTGISLPSISVSASEIELLSSPRMEQQARPQPQVSSSQPTPRPPFQPKTQPQQRGTGLDEDLPF